MERKTSLYETHCALGGRMVPFAGWLLPVQYSTGVIAEHMAVRQKAGLFDVSHMGEFLLKGTDALANLNHLLTNDFTNMYIGQVRYTAMCTESGGVIDDLVVCRLGETVYMAVVNAANREKDAAHMRANLSGDCTFEDLSDGIALLALQGPSAPAILQKLAPAEDIPKKYYSLSMRVPVSGIDTVISRTGYTGELGYELFCAAADAPALWDALLEAGSEAGLIPCGLGARDTLRLEAAMPLYGHEMDETVSPLEAGLGFAVKLEKPDFIGKTALLADNPPKRTRIGLAVTSRGIVREQCPVYQDGVQLGQTTSGTHAPLLGRGIAMALVPAGSCCVGDQLEAEVRGRRIGVEVVPLPFYKRA